MPNKSYISSIQAPIVCVGYTTLKFCHELFPRLYLCCKVHSKGLSQEPLRRDLNIPLCPAATRDNDKLM